MLSSLLWAFSSVVERLIDIEKVVGSIPTTPTNNKYATRVAYLYLRACMGARATRGNRRFNSKYRRHGISVTGPALAVPQACGTSLRASIPSRARSNLRALTDYWGDQRESNPR